LSESPEFSAYYALCERLEGAFRQLWVEGVSDQVLSGGGAFGVLPRGMGRKNGGRELWWGKVGVVALLAVTSLATAAAQSCPSTTCLRSASDGTCALTDFKGLTCEPTFWSRHITTFPGKWHGVNNLTSNPVQPGIEYLEEKLPCCRHCGWSLGYPIAVPEIMAISPDQALCASRTSAGQLSQCYLDCTKWGGDMQILDITADGYLNLTEFSRYVTEYKVAPPQLYTLYTGGGLSYDAEVSRLDASLAFQQVDLDKDGRVSLDEWLVFRHFIGPILVSKAGPSRSPSDGRPLADGPLGGLFFDQTLADVWATNQVNIMLDYYLTNRANGFVSSVARPPVAYERKLVMQTIDVDGSQRVGIDEHYFRLFADKNKDGSLSPEEYYSSLYRKTCQPYKSTGGVAADCGGVGASGVRADKADGLDVKMNFATHDVDNDGKVSFLERKFVASDLDHSGNISRDEWRLGDFPEAYGPFEGHAECGESDNGSCEKIDRLRYSYYMAFHECASQGSRAYNKPLSEFPWAASCPLVVQVEDHRPFSHVETYTTPEEKAALTARGFLCWDANEYEASSICITGYAIHAFDDIAKRLQWTYTPRLLRATASARRQSSVAIDSLTPPKIDGNGAANAVFQMGLFTSYQMPWRPPQYDPDEFRCSSSLWLDDGLIIVKRKAHKEVNVELAIVEMLITPTFVNFVVFIYLIVVVLGHLFWFLERSDNALFAEAYTEGIIDGMWYSIVTMSTVGYGDKVPVTGIGKMATILWMFFGIISFGVFSGNVSSQIALSSLENTISSPTDLASFSVGVIKTLASPAVENVDLDKEFGFNQVQCDDIAHCYRKLEKYEVTAFVAPHSDVLSYFNRTGLNNEKCGNPAALPGAAFTTETTAAFTGSTVKICSYSKSVYAAQYLADAVTKMQKQLKEDGTSDALEARFLKQDQPNEDADGCGESTRYKIALIVSTVLIVFFYFIIITLIQRRRKIEVQKQVLSHLMTSVTGRNLTLTPMECAKKYGTRWLEKVRAKRAEREEAKRKRLAELGAHDYLVHIVKRIRRMSLQQTNEIRNVIHDTHTARDRVSRLVTFITFFGLVLVVVVVCLTITLLVLWSNIVRLINV